MRQPTLFDYRAGREASIQERFERWHAQHPDVYALFKRFAFEFIESGRQHYGAKGILERVRWECATSSQGDSPKIDNNFISRMVRLFENEYPEFRGFFATRKLKSV